MALCNVPEDNIKHVLALGALWQKAFQLCVSQSRGTLCRHCRAPIGVSPLTLYTSASAILIQHAPLRHVMYPPY